jgi:hypothetical protein
MDYKVRSHDLGNFPRSYYYIKKVLQFVRLVINIRLKERVYSIFRNKVHIIHMQQDAWHMHGVSYAILTLWNSCSAGYFTDYINIHSTTSEKSICLFTDVAIQGCMVCDKTKKDDTTKQLYYPAYYSTLFCSKKFNPPLHHFWFS